MDTSEPRFAALVERWDKLKILFAPMFWARVRVGKPSECWPWIGYKSERGYGGVRRNGKSTLAHRVAYELTFGHVVRDLFVCHKCDNPSCCNPSHLFVGTALDNTQDCISKGRKKSCPGQQNGMYGVRGESHPCALMTEAQVREIRKFYATKCFTQKALAAKFGVSQSQISALVLKRTWRHI